MTSPSEAPKRRRRWTRLLLAALGAVLVLLVAFVLCLPWIVNAPFAQRFLASQAARIMAPGGVRFDRIRVSWTRPTEIDGLVLTDPQGDEIVSSPKAHFSWSLREMIFTRPVEMTLTLDHASVDIQRDESGQLDLLETLKPLLTEKPAHTLLIRIPDGKLRFRAAGLNEPFLAEPAHIDLDLNAYPGPVAWRMNLQREVPGGEPGRVDVQGNMSRQKRPDGAPQDLTLSVNADRWPWRFSNEQVKASGGLSGTIEVDDTAERLGLRGDARVLDLRATGDLLSGDRLALETISAAWDVSRKEHAWSAEHLDLTTTLGTLRASGTYPPTGDREAHLTGNLDLAAVARQLPRTLRLREDLRLDKGAVELRADVSGDAGRGTQTISANAKLSDLEARHGTRTLTFRDPATVGAKLHRQAETLTLEQLDVKTPFLTASGSGDLDRGIHVKAVVDLGAGSQRLRDWIDMGRLELAGEGKVDARYQRIVNRFEATAEAEFKGLDVKGLPTIENFHRDALTSTFKASGGAGSSGLPASLHDLDLTGRGDAESLSVTATRDQAAGTTRADVKGNTTLVINGKKQTVAADIRSRWEEARVTVDPITVSLTPVVGPGGQFLPSDPVQWSGKGTYDRAKDVLRIAANPQANGTQPPALALTEISAAGLARREAIRLEMSLAGNLAGLMATRKPDRRPLEGQLAGLVQAHQHADGWELGARLQARDLATVDGTGARQVLAGDAAASVRGRLASELDRLNLSELAVVTPYGKVDGSGLVSDLKGSPHFDLKGMVSPDWGALSEQLASKVEPNASIDGTSRPWRLSGTLSKSGDPDLFTTLSGELGLGLRQVDVFGMRLGETVVTVRAQDGKVRIDPIDSTLNSGRLHLEPDVVTDKQGKHWLHLGTTSGLLDAVVNDEVSHRVLSFAAPVLDQATRVRGRVSLALNDAYIPLGQGPDVQARIDGDVLFDAVEFMPGPFMEQILGVFRQELRPLLVLRDPVSIRIVGRKIYQEGLIIPLGNVAAIGLEGWMDFDQNLDMVASFAMIPPRRNIPVLSDLLASTQLQVPITGTLKKPRLNGEAIKDRFKEMGTNVLDTLIGVGANGLNRILRGGPPANAPRGDFFPPFVPPGDDEPIPPPPVPGGNGPVIDTRPAPGDRDARPPGEQPPPRRAPGNPDDELDRPPPRPGQLSAEQRQMQREERKQRRLEKRADRRLRRGLLP